MTNTEPNSIINLQAYLDKGKPFRIPDYQRGYIWGKSRGSEKDSASFLMESILNSFLQKTDSSQETEFFLQGITVCERPERPEHPEHIELIDGQQRTTFLYLLLNYLKHQIKPESQVKFQLQYSIREKSADFLSNIKEKATRDEILQMCAENDEEEYQDIFYFKRTIRIIHELIEKKDVDKDSLYNFVLNNIKFLYISIPPDKAVMVFSMMNGNKAVMKYEELIKAELLRLVSLDAKEGEEKERAEAIRWEQNLLRSRYAREWDKWLYWWNREEVRAFYHTDNVMGVLIETYYNAQEKGKNKKFNFENFRDFCLREKSNESKKSNELCAKDTFYKLRHLQKRFEDAYNVVERHNRLGLILILLDKNNRKKFIEAYFAKQEEIDLELYLKYVLLGVSHANIMLVKTKNDDEKAKATKAIEEGLGCLKAAIHDDFLYQNKEHYEQAAKQLLRLNMEQDTALGRFFDFKIWRERSLEHIYPKSKVYHKEDDGQLYNGNGELLTDSKDASYLDRNVFKGNGTEHCIGNLVLLYKNDNSKFGNRSFDEKKAFYFNLEETKDFRSRHLLHSLSVFAKKKWGVEEIQENKEGMIKCIEEYYKDELV